MKYKILLEKTEEGYSVSCPGLPAVGRKARPKRRPWRISMTPFGNTWRRYLVWNAKVLRSIARNSQRSSCIIRYVYEVILMFLSEPVEYG